MKMTRTILTLSLGASLLLFSCSGGNTAEQKDEKAKEVAVQAKSDALNPVYDKYIELRDALYNNDFEKAKALSGELKSVIAGINASSIPGGDWDKTSKNIENQASKLQEAKNITEARVNFSDISTSIIDVVKKTGLKNENAYVQHCPMAKNSKGNDDGADWLDKKESVENPYFGAKDEMKGCGETKEKLKFQ